jgi:HEAT repeat protein
MIDPKTTEAVELLKSRDLRKRIQALELASQLEGREALALLLKALHDQSWTLRDHAIPKLKKRGGSAVLPILHHLQSGVWFTRAALAQVLEETGDERAVAPLLQLLSDSNKSVTESAQKAMASIIARSDPQRLGEQISAAGSSRRQALIQYLQQTDPAKAGAAISHLGPVQDGPEPADPKDASEKIQQLRKAIKSSLKTGEQDYDES